MSATMQQPAIGSGNGQRRGKPGAKRTRRTKAQIAAGVALNDPKLIDLRAQPAAVVRGDPATDFAATTIAQLVGKDPAVRRRAAQLIGAVCSELLKA